MKTTGMILALAVFGAWTATAFADNGEVARAQFTTGIEDREPVDDIDRLDSSHDQVFFFTELRGMQGRTVTHRWMHDGEVQATVDFDVGGSRWRVWSSKDLLPDWSGGWSVVVVDEEGEQLDIRTFIYTNQGSAGM